MTWVKGLICKGWLFSLGSFFLLILFIYTLPESAHGAQPNELPPVEGISVEQIERIKTALYGLGFTITEPYVNWNPEVCPNTQGVRFRTATINPAQLSPGGEVLEAHPYLFPKESEECVSRQFGWEFEVMSKLHTAGLSDLWQPQRYSLNGGLEAAVMAETWTLKDISGTKYPYGIAKGIFTCGTTFFHVYAGKVSTQSVVDYKDNWNPIAQKLAEEEIPRVKEWIEKITNALQTANACSIPSSPTPSVTPPTITLTPTNTPTPDIAGFALVGLGCSGDPLQTGKLKRVVCVPATINEPLDEPASFTWELDGQPLTDTTRSLTWENVAFGEHTVRVTATFRGVTKSYTGLVTVIDNTKPPGLSLSMTCKEEGAPKNRKISCKAIPDQESAGSNLNYGWYYDGQDMQNIADVLSLTAADTNQHMVQVKASNPLEKSKSDIVTYIVPSVSGNSAAVPGPGQMQVSSPGGSAVVNSGQQTGVTVKEGQKADIKLTCENLRYAYSLMNIVYDIELDVVLNSISENPDKKLTTSEAIVLAMIIKCGDVLTYFSPNTRISASEVNLILPQAAEIGPAVRLKVRLSHGPMRFNVPSDQVAVEVETGSTVISSVGKNDFGVGYSPNSNDTIIKSYKGTVNILPKDPSLQPVSLQAGETILVNQSKIEKVTETSQKKNPSLSNALPLIAAVVFVVLLGLGILSVGTFWYWKRSRQGVSPEDVYSLSYDIPVYENSYDDAKTSKRFSAQTLILAGIILAGLFLLLLIFILILMLLWS